MNNFLGSRIRSVALGTALLGSFAFAAPQADAAAMMQQVDEIRVEGIASWAKEEVLHLLPALSYKEVNLHDLSRQIQQVNDAGAILLHADFRKNSNGRYDVVIEAKEKKAEACNVSVNNSGNDYTGDWRTTVSYMNRNLTKQSDTLGIAYVTSPGYWSDVKQAALAYRFLLPKNGDSMYLTYSYSDVDLGTIANVGGLGISATGKGQSVGMHYQKNLTYTGKKRQMIDFGVDAKRYEDGQDFSYGGSSLLASSRKFTVKTASVSYLDQTRWQNRTLAYSLGYVGSIGNGRNFETARAGSDPHFHLWTASLNYQQRTEGDWILGLRGNAQYTSDTVVTPEQIGAGGIYTVRGFRERAVSADKGVIGSIEAYTPELGDSQRLVFFLDAALLSNNRPNYGELRREGIASVGIGYRMFDNGHGVDLSLDYAKAISGLANDRDARRPWNVRVSKSF